MMKPALTWREAAPGANASLPLPRFIPQLPCQPPQRQIFTSARPHDLHAEDRHMCARWNPPD